MVWAQFELQALDNKLADITTNIHHQQTSLESTTFTLHWAVLDTRVPGPEPLRLDLTF